jgi:tRNA modification GTPase
VQATGISSDTIVALATPPGVGAIAVIRLSGPEAITIADTVFKGKKLARCATHTAHFGRLVRPDGSTADEVLATLFHGPRSYTGENVVEFSCHGSTFIQQEIIQLCLQAGARLAQPGEYTLRAFLNGKMDLSQAEAVADLIASESKAAADVALRQLRGGFRHEIAELRSQLIHFAGLVELELDFSEEDVEFADRTQLKQLVTELRRQVNALLQSFQLGNAIKTGVSTVIAGRPNAGKSTLLNALLNEERAIVSDIAGTTRDTIEEVLNIRGVQFRLIDTAGIREAQDQIEAIGVQKTFEKVRNAALLVYVWDITSGMTLRDLYQDLEQLLRETDSSCLVVCNKMDRKPLFDTAWVSDPNLPGIHPYLLPPDGPAVLPPALNAAALSVIPVSAKHQMNVEHLKERLYAAALGGASAPEGTVVTNARHFDALRRADQSLSDVLTGLEQGITGDFVAQDIRHALAYLGEITGEIGVEDLLGEIFGKFCIGK